MISRCATVFLATVVFCWARGSLTAETEQLSFCHFGPKLKVLSSRSQKDGCWGDAKIQALLWECVPAGVVEKTVADFRKTLVARASEECRIHCARRSKNCVGRLDLPTACGLETTREDAVVMGKREGCRDGCKGTAFAFCSLYDAGFRTDDEERVAKQKPNCHCAPRSP